MLGLGLVCCGRTKDVLRRLGFFAQVDVVSSSPSSRFRFFLFDRKSRNLVDRETKPRVSSAKGLAHVLVLFGFSRIVFFLSLFVASRLVLM